MTVGHLHRRTAGHEPAAPGRTWEHPAADCVRALVVAGRTLTAYPPGHPAATAALNVAHRHLVGLSAPGHPLVIAVGQRSLVVGGARLASLHAERLAQVFYRRNVGLVRIAPEVEPADLEVLFRLLFGEREMLDDGPSVAEHLAAAGVAHIQLEPVDFSTLRVTDGVRTPGAGGTAESLWERLVQGLLARSQTPGEGDAVWREILNLARRNGDALAAADRLGSAVEQHLASTPAPGHTLAARQVAEFVRRLPAAMREPVLAAALRAVVTSGTDAGALQALTSPFAPDVVLRVLRDLEASGVRLSAHALRLAHALGALAAASGVEAEEVDTPPDLAELAVIYRDEDIDRYNPEPHQALLSEMSIELASLAGPPGGAVADLGDRVESLDDDVLAVCLTDTLFHLLEHRVAEKGIQALLARLEELFRLFLRKGRFDVAGDIVERLAGLCGDDRRAPGFLAAGRATLSRLTHVEVIAAMITSLSPPWEESLAGARRVLRALGEGAVKNLLFLLVEEHRRSRRRRIFDLLVSLGRPAAGGAQQWLSDPRWYVVRNMIALLRALDDRSSLPEIQRCAFHPDRRVRLEALRSLLVLGGQVPAEILGGALRDPSPRIVETVVGLLGRYGSIDAVAPLLGMLRGWDLLGRRRAIRVCTLRALGELGYPSALPHLTRFFRNWWLPLVALEERRAAFESLRHYPGFVRRPLVLKGLRSGVPEIRETCRALATEPG